MEVKTAQNLSRLIVDDMPLEKLRVHRDKLTAALKEARAGYGFEQAVRDGYMLPVASESASGFVPKDMFLEINLQTALKWVNEREQALIAAMQKDRPIGENGGRAVITDEMTLIDTARQSFDMQEIENRRFMFSPRTGTLIIGEQYPRNTLMSSHAEEHERAETDEPFDDFICGWVGTGGRFESGVIHFAPPIPKGYPQMFENGFSTLEMFAQNGANIDTVIRGFPGAWEQPLSNLINFEKFIGKEDTTMDENSTLQNNSGNSAPLEKNEYVQELFSILQDNGRDTKGLAALIGHVSEMESFVQKAEVKISEMKSQLAEMKEVQNHPVKTALQNAIKSLETKVAEVKERIAELKTNIIEGCKSAVTAFKENGAAALNNLARFFHIKGGLKAIDKSAEQSVKQCDKAIANINEFGQNYHAAGRAVKNMGLLIIGREPVDAKKENGTLVKIVAAPYKAERAALNGIKKAVDKAIAALDGMEERQAAKKQERSAERAEKPDMLARIAKNQERVERDKRELPMPERAKVAGLDV
jgi:hypothetical protein